MIGQGPGPPPANCPRGTENFSRTTLTYSPGDCGRARTAQFSRQGSPVTGPAERACRLGRGPKLHTCPDDGEARAASLYGGVNRVRHPRSPIVLNEICLGRARARRTSLGSRIGRRSCRHIATAEHIADLPDRHAAPWSWLAWAGAASGRIDADALGGDLDHAVDRAGEAEFRRPSQRGALCRVLPRPGDGIGSRVSRGRSPCQLVLLSGGQSFSRDGSFAQLL